MDVDGETHVHREARIGARGLLLALWIGLWLIAPFLALVPMAGVQAVQRVLPDLPPSLGPVEDLIVTLCIVNGVALLCLIGTRLVAPLMALPRAPSVGSAEGSRVELRLDAVQLLVPTILPLLPLYPYAFFWGAVLWSMRQSRSAFVDATGQLQVEPSPVAHEILVSVGQVSVVALFTAVVVAVVVLIAGACLRVPRLRVRHDEIEFSGIVGRPTTLGREQVEAAELGRRGHLVFRGAHGVTRAGRLRPADQDLLVSLGWLLAPTSEDGPPADAVAQSSAG